MLPLGFLPEQRDQSMLTPGLKTEHWLPVSRRIDLKVLQLVCKSGFRSTMKC